MRRFLKWAAIVLFGVPVVLVILVVSLFAIQYFYSRLVPSDVAELHIKEIGTTLKLRLYSASPIGKAEFDRELAVETSNEKATQALALDWGGATRTSVYLTENKQVVILGPADSRLLIAFNPIQFSHRIDLPSDGWTYLGAFDRGQEAHFTLRFYAPNESAECIPTLMDDAGGPHRKQFYKRRC